jgi:hypothetical protein
MGPLRKNEKDTAMNSTSAATQKDFARALDAAAARAGYIDREPASGKQCWFLASLMLKAGADLGDILVDTHFVLTKSKASSMIDSYLRQQAN